MDSVGPVEALKLPAAAIFLAQTAVIGPHTMFDAKIQAGAAGDPDGRPQWPAQRFACIVGAPRCGTTTLARLLKSHPDVSFSVLKEPHFFSTVDLGEMNDGELRDFVADHYLARFFPEIDARAEMMAEASVSYLYAPERLLPLLRLWPDAKFVIAVRDPLELIPSLHQRLLFQGDETVTDLEEAWRLIGERRQGRKVPRSCLDARQLFYDEAASLGKHVGHFFDVVGRERCHVVVFDDLKADTAAVYADLLDFLDLAPAPLPERQQHRARNGFKIGWLQRLLKRPPVATAVLAGRHFRRRVTAKPNREPSRLSRRIMDVRKRLLRWNEAPAPPVRMSPSLAEEIRSHLRDDTALLQQLLGRDIGHWLGGSRARAMEPAP